MKGIEKLKLTEYVPFRDFATFTFIGRNGQPKSIQMSRFMFRTLMGELDWNTDILGAITSMQSEFKECVTSEIRKDFGVWFDRESNEYLRQKA
jgi:hypothetical protein